MKNKFLVGSMFVLAIIFSFCLLSLGLNKTIVEANYSQEKVANDLAQNNQSLIFDKISNNQELLNTSYIQAYKINSSNFSAVANGGEARPLTNAFDGNWNTYWQSEKDNTMLTNAITITFNKAVTINRILYASSSARIGHGYPVELNIYTALNSDLELYGSVSSSATNDQVVFKFNKPQTITQLKFEFKKVNPAHNWIASAKEIQFFMPDNTDVTNIINGELFENYTQTSLKPQYNNLSLIQSYKQQFSTFENYETSLKPMLDRAEKIIKGEIKFDARREFSTANNALNKIEQHGNLRTYASNALKMSSFGINRQVTGIAGVSGQEIIIYVEAEDDDPLPSVVFTQAYSAWQKWKSEVTLKRGKNTLIFPNLKDSNYTAAIEAGGPIHIVNPYTETEQSKNVKIYIENGSFYPVFRDGDDEKTFKLYLEDYYNKLNDPNNETVKINVFETVSNHIMLTSFATVAYDNYVTKNVSPQNNIDKWNDYIINLLKFGGVALNENEPYFDKRNLFLYTNIRAAQPWPGGYAFAANDHIGITDSGTFSQLVNKGITGWAFAHEVGHALDNTQRTWGEVTNNVYSLYDLYSSGQFTDRFHISTMSQLLTSDVTLTKTAFQSFGDNCLIWNVLEGAKTGYWANLENLYRFEETGKNLGRTERMVYYSSLAMGENLSEYFERWGFYMSGDSTYSANNRFTYNNSSNEFKTLLTNAINENRILSEAKEFWYVDLKQFEHIFNNGGTLNSSWAQCYASNQTTQIVNITKTGSAYSLFLPQPTNKVAHLGYEISAKIDDEWKVIGFTYSTSFLDTNTYSNPPTYKVRAFDRMFNSTSYSNEIIYNEQTALDVCKIGDNYYNSLSSAIAAASSGDTIYVLKNINETNIVVDKNLTITLPENQNSNLSILRNGVGDMFVVNSGVTLTLVGNNNHNLVLDGNNLAQAGSLINVKGNLIVLGNVTLKNNINTANGGAIYANGKLTLLNCEILNNQANNGAAIYSNNFVSTLENVVIKNNTTTSNAGGIYSTGNFTLQNCTFENNFAGTNGGAIFNTGGGIVKATNCTFKNNSASANGGAIFIDGNTTLTNCTITNNSANNGAGVCMQVSNNVVARTFALVGGNIFNNTATNGDALYLSKGNLQIKPHNGTPTILDGEIYKTNNAAITIFNVWVPMENILVVMENINDGNTLFTLNNFEATENQIKTLNIKNGVAIANNNIIKVNKATINVNILIDGKTVVMQVPYGEFKLPTTFDGLEENMYVTSWECEGKTYSPNDTINLTHDVNIKVSVENKCEVTIYSNGTKEVVYVVPNAYYYLPLNNQTGAETIKWICENNEYLPATKVLITSNKTFYANVIGKFVLNQIVDGNEHFEYFNFGDSYTLTQPNISSNKTFLGWEVNGQKLNAGESITIWGDTVVKALIEDKNNGDNNTLLYIIIPIVAVIIISGVVIILVIKRKRNGKK